MELGVLGPLQVRQFGLPVAIPGAKPRAILTMLGLYGGAVVPGDTLVELLWGTDPPRTAAKALQTHISALRRALGDGFVLTQGTGWTLNTADIDAIGYTTAAAQGRAAMDAGDAGEAVARFDDALKLWRGAPELPDGRRGGTERTRWVEGHAALVEDRADALLATGRAAELIGELEAAIADAPLRERRWGQLMLALYRAGRQGEALAAFQRVRALLADELGVDPGPDLRRLESKIVVQDASLELPVLEHVSSVMRAVTFLLTDIEGSTAAWEYDAEAMGAALARHDEIVEQVVTFGGGRLIKTRGEGDATFSVFDRPSGAAAAAVELQQAIGREPWALVEPMRIRIALHTGEVEFRDGDYFGRAVNRAARLRSLAVGGQTLCSGATAELVIDSLADNVVLADLGMRQLKNLARLEHVFELRLERADDFPVVAADTALDRPGLPAVLTGPGPFVGRGSELEGLLAAWQTALTAGAHAVLIAGEPGVGKTRLAGEWCRQAYGLGAVVVYGRCDEDLGAPYQPFAEALRTLVPCLGADRLRGLRGVESLLPLVPALTDVLPDLAAAPRAAPDAERYALFDAVVALLGIASASAPIVLVLDDLHWAAKPTLLLLRHLLRFGEQARVQIVGTYRSTDLDRAHPLAAMLADLHRDGSATRLALGGLDVDDVNAYVAEVGYDDEELGRALASVTGGNPFFLIEALRHVDESDGRWDANSLPQGIREAVSRRLSRLGDEANAALAAAAVVGSRFGIELVERVVERDLVDAFDEAGKAGIVIEEPGGRYRFNHALVRQSLLAELPSVRRMRLHQKIAAALEAEPGTDDELLAELAYHYFECAWAGNAGKAVEYCRRAADQAMARLGYEGAADLYDKALHALEELDEELPDRDDQQAELLVARCEALLAAGDVASATGAVAQLRSAAGDSARIAAWGACFDGQLSMLTDPERLDEIEVALEAAAATLAALEDAAGEAKAHTVRAGCLARLGRVGDCEAALDQALTAARRAREHRRVNAVLAGAPPAALWGPNPVPRAGGRCLDVVRLLRITTGSPVVEATSTRCQGVLDALRGRAAAGRQLIDSARRTLSELGMRHAVLEVEQFAGIVELVADDATAAERHLRKAYNGFRRMRLDADTAETAALLARACLALDRDAEADELCTESERLAGHAFKAAIAWRTVRAQLLARAGEHGEARRVAEEAVAIAERTDALVDHGDACLALAVVLGAAGDAAGARVAAERALGLYEMKGAAALAEKARRLLGEQPVPAVPAPTEAATTRTENACFQAGRRIVDAVERQAWGEVKQLLAPEVHFESRRLIVGVAPRKRSFDQWRHEMSRYIDLGMIRYPQTLVAARGERLVLVRLSTRTNDASLGAPQDEFLQLAGIDDEGRMFLQMWFDIDDLDAAIAEMDSLQARFETEKRRPRLENSATRADSQAYALFAGGHLDEIGALYADNLHFEDRRRGLRRESNDRETALENVRTIADIGVVVTHTPLALRGDRLSVSHVRFEERDRQVGAFFAESLEINEVDTDGLMVARVVFDLDDLDAAIAELDDRYLAGEAAPYAHAWSVVVGAYAAFNRREIAATSPGWVNIDHRRGAAFAPGHMAEYLSAAWADSPDTRIFVDAVHRLSEFGAVVTHAAKGISQAGFEAEWRDVNLLTVEGDLVTRSELFDADDLDRALARFDELSCPAVGISNAASVVYERLWRNFAAGDWDTVADLFAEGVTDEDRRRTVHAGMKRGRDVQLADLRRLAGIGATVSATVLATRGQRLVLDRLRTSSGDLVRGEILNIIETDSEGRIVAGVIFDNDDLDAAVAELDVRYLAGEAAPYADAWSVITDAYAGMTRGEVPKTTADLVNVDHRHVAPMAPDEGIAYLHASWDLAPQFNLYIESVHRLSDLGAVFTRSSRGTSREGFDAEWRAIDVVTVDADAISRGEIFDESDLAAALERFDELNRPAPRLENAASRLVKRYWSYYPARDWDTMAEILAHDFNAEDRRRVVNAGMQRGRDAEIANLQVMTGLGTKNALFTVIATRGERVALTKCRMVGRDQGPGAFHSEAFDVVEINTDDTIAGHVLFDLDDLDAALAELDVRYLAGEAAPCADTYSVIAQVFYAVNRLELPAAAPGFVDIDHRSVTGVESGGLQAYLRAAFDDLTENCLYVESVHRLTEVGAVVTHVAKGVSREGLDVEWRLTDVLTIDGDLPNRCELFDEADLGAALARFDEINRPTPILENAASRQYRRFNACDMSGDWEGLAKTMADDFIADDRRRLVGTGHQPGRNAAVEHMRFIAGLGVRNASSTVIAIRGDSLALMRSRFWGRDEPDAFAVEVLHMVEINAAQQITMFAAFDLDDLDAAYAELDARYVLGEAAGYAGTWSVIAGAFTAFNRHELPATTPDWINIDHRPVIAVPEGGLYASVDDLWDLTPDVRMRIEAVHRLTDLGAVVTYAASGTSGNGFDVEWREVSLSTITGGLVDRCEVFRLDDLDAALATFDELSEPVRRLENAASRTYERWLATYGARDWDAMSDVMGEGIVHDDHRRVVNGGTQRGREAVIANMRAIADVGVTNIEPHVIATRGERLALARQRVSGDKRPDAFGSDVLIVIEVDADSRFVGGVAYDPDDLDAAFADLDSRFGASEAAAHAAVWSVVKRNIAAFNRHELPSFTPGMVNVDHRRVIASAPGDLAAYVHATWKQTPDLKLYIEAVHRLSDLGAVFTYVATGTTNQDFQAEWRGISFSTIDGDLISRSERFDEDDLDTALARFDQLSRPAGSLENAASRSYQRCNAYLVARDWDAMAEMVAEDVCTDDRRRVVSGGIRRGRAAQIADMRAAADVGVTYVDAAVVATRGDRLALIRARVSGGPRDDAFGIEILTVYEVDADDRSVAAVLFDLEDFDAAIAELESRYLAGEAAPFASGWSLYVRSYAAINRRELPEGSQDWVNVDHRKSIVSATTDMAAYVRATFDEMPSLSIYVEAVHRLSDDGFVVTHVMKGLSREGFEAEWREVVVGVVNDDQTHHSELFDVEGLDAALARFDELSRPARRLGNAASRLYDRSNACLMARDWDTVAEMVADDIFIEDRRRVVNLGIERGRDAVLADMRAIADLGVNNVERSVIATRGSRLALARARLSGDGRFTEYEAEALNLVEIDPENRISAVVAFDLDDIDAAVAELDARYVAGEAAPHARTWSVVSGAVAGINRRELFPTTPDWANIDHRRLSSIGHGELVATFRAMWELVPDLVGSIDAVHRLTNVGAVIAATGYGTSQQGLCAEWSMIAIFMVDGDLISRHELFDESDLEAALTRFDELSRPAPRLENAASRLNERSNVCLMARDWDAIAEMLADDIVHEDRRRVVNMGIQRGRDAVLTDMRAIADLGVNNVERSVIATRGNRLALVHARVSRDGGFTEYELEVLNLVEIDADNRIAAAVSFDPDDIDAAFTELEMRYLKGEAADNARVWRVIARFYAAVNHGELPPTTKDWVNVDRRRGVAMSPGDLEPFLNATWKDSPQTSFYVEAVHRLSNRGAVVTRIAKGTTREGFSAEWRQVGISMVEGEAISHSEIFDEADLAAALARFDELDGIALLDNFATQVVREMAVAFNGCDLEGYLGAHTADSRCDDRRRGLRNKGPIDMVYGRALFERAGIFRAEVEVVAIRGRYLALSRLAFRDVDEVDRPVAIDALVIHDVNVDRLVTNEVIFDPDDMDAALAELDTRYMAGEGASFADTWSAISRMYAALNRRELPATTPGWVTVDHQRGRAFTFAPGETATNIQESWAQLPTGSIRVEAVHRLSAHGAVVTHSAHGTSQEGLDVEWRCINVLMVDDGLIERCELFGEADLDAALECFDELGRKRDLGNAATRVGEQLTAAFAARNWEAMAGLLADGLYNEDRRRVVNGGIRQGRDSLLEDMRAAADVGVSRFEWTSIATRGERLILVRAKTRYDERPGAFHVDNLAVAELDADGRIAAQVIFEPDDMDAAVTELDARYMAGEPAALANMWSLVTQTYAAFNRHEMPKTRPDWVNIDHRLGVGFAPGAMNSYVSAFWEQVPDISTRIEAVHRLSNLGAVFTHTERGTSQEGFDAEWSEIALLTFDGDAINRCELFDETDRKAAVARFDELDARWPGLENIAIRVRDRVVAASNLRDLEAVVALHHNDARFDDRRKSLRNVGHIDRNFLHAVLFDAPASWRLAAEPVAIRGTRLALTRDRFRDTDSAGERITVEFLMITEVSGELVSYVGVFDPDDINGAIDELTARWIASGEVAHPEIIEAMRPFAEAANRHDWDALAARHVGASYVNHRQLASGAGTAVEDMSSLRMLASLVPDLRFEVAEILACSATGVLSYVVVKGTSTDDVAVELPWITIMVFDGDRAIRAETFDADQRDLALARFDELSRSVPGLENTASRVFERIWAHCTAREWGAVSRLLADDHHSDDRRRGVGAGLRHGREAELADLQHIAEFGDLEMTARVLAIRGEHLALCHHHVSRHDQLLGPLDWDLLSIVEINGEELLKAAITFDVDDVDAAFAELESRYLAGEAAVHAHAWSVITNGTAAFNRREVPPTTPDWVSIDHRHVAAFAPGDFFTFVRATSDVVPYMHRSVEAVHRLTDFGAVVSGVANGTSHMGFNAEWRTVVLVMIDGDLISRYELFDETDLDAALANFDELSRQAPQLKNAASRAWSGLIAALNRRDNERFLAGISPDGRLDDRRKGLTVVMDGAERQKAFREIFKAPTSWQLDVEGLAARGSRLALTHVTTRDTSDVDRPITVEVLTVVEVGDGELVRDTVTFDIDDVDAAYEELDARYLAGEAAPYANTWAVLVQNLRAVNRHELPAWTPDAVSIDHRIVAPISPGDLPAFLNATWETTPDVKFSIDAVHRLSERGAVLTIAAVGASSEGFQGEWRGVHISMIDGDRVCHSEHFDEADLDAALARFDELNSA
ncbi:AAA family ATPase [Mycobacterium sp. Y57]|uniref:BTAD domain-containing putative transcriptional regulator n=1 Tax=Mycolicibacterium xanthum TaxID=2796469 RepID=UPI001C864F5A|nr:BTAD domain-containing putative transcriptional regulator [Mycolicibacterium xanthum]MBX7432011.1 AAA family ATPase [Mycolicibacterium xanthum]